MRCWTLLFILTFCSQSFLYSQCDFTVPGTNFCGGENINFTVNNPTGSIYTWDFDGDGMADATGISVGYAFPAVFTNQSYSVSLLENGVACETQNINILAVPDATIGLVPSGVAVMNGTNINACSGTPEVSIAIFNNSTTISINTGYEINWGDGSPVENYTNATFSSATSISHTYSGFGYKTLSVTVTANNGCTSTTNYTFYNGGNPSIGLGNPGNTVGLCAPATIVFPVSDYADNPVGTIYEVFVNNVLVDNLTQATIQDEYTYTFNGTSCGEMTSTGQFEHAFDLKIVASNPCGSSAATVEPIELSSSPQASFDVQEPVNSCPGETWVFTDNSVGVNEVISGNPTICENELLPSWSISPNQPGVLWNLISGNLFSSEAIEVAFLEPGSYTITMVLNSIACGPSTYTETIFVLEPPVADADLADASDDCVPATVSFNNLSAGFQMNYTWGVDPPTGWNFTGGTNENSENPTFIFTAAGSYNVRLTTSNICAEDTWDTTLVFLGPPAISLTPAPDECQSATLNFDASTLTYNANSGTITSYSWSFPGAIPNSSTAAFPTGIQYNGAGTYSYSVTAVGAECGPTTVSDTFTIIDPVLLMLPEDLTFCVDDDPVSLTASHAPGIWSGSGVTAAGIFDPSLAMIGENIVSYTFGNGLCTSTETMSIVVNALPAITLSANNETSACISETTIPLTATPVGGTWTASNGGVLTGNVFNPNATGIGSYTLTYNYTDPATNCENSASFIFTVLPLPQITVSDTSYCDAVGLVGLPFASPTGGTWSGPGVENGQFNPQGTGVGATNELIYTYTDNNICTNTAMVTINITNPVTVDAGPDVSLCKDVLAYNLNDFATPTTGIWDDNGQPGLTGSIFNPSIVPPGNYTFTLRVGTGNCEVADELTITVLALPSINIDNNETSACILETSIVLNASPDTEGWTVNNGGVLTGNVFNPSASGVGQYTLTYSYTDPNTTCTNSASFTFTVNPLPQIVVNDTTYCNAPGLVDLPFATPVGGIWSGDGIENGQFNPQGVNVGATNTLTYTYIDGSGCTDSETITISIIELAVIEAGANDTLCVDQGLYTIPNFLPATGGTWSGPGIINASEGVFDPILAGGDTHTLYYRYGTGNCLVEDSITLTVIAISLNAGEEEDVCITADPFSLNGSTGANGTWTINGVEADIFDPAALGLGEHLVSYILVDEGSGCVFEDSKTITVQPLANSSFTAPAVACVGETVNFLNTSNNAFDAYWTFGDGEDDEEVSPNHIFEATGFYTVSLVTETEFGCLDTFLQSIFIEAPPQPSFDFTISRSCEGISVYLSDSIIDGTSYSLDYGIGNTDNEWIDSIFYPGGEDTLVYTISLTAINFCGPTTFTHPTEIIVPPAFNANFGILPLDNNVNTYCSPETLEFANISTGEIDSFTVDYGNGNFSTNEFVDQFYENASDTLVSYTITMIIYGPHCSPDTATQEISLFPVFFQTAFNVADTVLCENAPLIFTNFTTPYPGIEYYEFDMGDGTVVVLNEDELDDFEYAYENSGQYTVQLVASDGCSESSYSIDVTVVAAPAFELNLQDFGCTGEEIIFAATEADSMTAFIFEINGDTVSVLPDFRYVFDAPATYYIKVTAENPLTECVTILIDSIEINENVGFPLLERKNLACDVLELSFTNAAISYVDWGDGDFIDAPGMNVSHLYAEAGVYFVEIVHADAFGCEYKEAHTIEVMENDLEVVAYDPVTINLGETAELGATVTGTGPFAYRWEPADQVETVNERETKTRILLDHTVFTIYVENANACIDTAKMNVRVRNKQRLYIPNAFSPNGDNFNDRFKIFGGPEVLLVTEFSVFDRFGTQVYGLTTPTLIDAVTGWDGQLKGKVLDPGVFAYFIEVEYINGEVEFFKGDVTLVR